ncbi:S-adenosylmethionine uptake transporter [Tranquillimonas rosea]|uniref:S-adenosylmethionine uptake transporter n=1 Tax=Tranquillimonas rosea TaxID=641238 RepID=A0A1H9U9X1_9RHOB|nr:DMT family transporter [Tranquillimonas rosea]SES06132.1 S-adenosylmethionine uptake transporter [Tranquillimonas rosea]
MTDPARPGPRGALLALCAFALFASHDAVIKALGGYYAPFQIMFFSVLFSFPLATLLLMRDPTPGHLRPVHPWWTALRTLAAVVTGISAFTAFSLLPLAQVYAFLFATPLLITLLSIPLLGERVGLHRGGAVLAGLVGVLVVLRPGSEALSLGHIAAMTSAVGSATASTIVRKIGRDERPLVLMLYPMVTNVVVMGALLPFVYRPMPIEHIGLLGLVSVFGFCAGLLVIAAYRAAPAALVAPMQYSQILWAALFGALFFGERPDWPTWIGVTIIVASGLYILLRESGAGRSLHRPVLGTRTRFELGLMPRIGVLVDRRRRSRD